MPQNTYVCTHIFLRFLQVHILTIIAHDKVKSFQVLAGFRCSDKFYVEFKSFSVVIVIELVGRMYIFFYICRVC